MVSSKVE